MDVFSAISRRRTIRRFRNQKVPDLALEKMVDAARLAPSASNRQLLEYIAVNDKTTCEQLFEHLEWGSNMAGGDAPPEGRRPCAYIAVLINRNISESGGEHDAGAAVQNILLSSFDSGFGTCWLRSFKKKKIQKLLSVPAHMDLDSIIALGVPGESPLTEVLTDSVKYWRDERGVLHVPKRLLGDILHKNSYSKK